MKYLGWLCFLFVWVNAVIMFWTAWGLIGLLFSVFAPPIAVIGWLVLLLVSKFTYFLLHAGLILLGIWLIGKDNS
jgi:hypothetical protein